jgi:hypothetical protein
MTGEGVKAATEAAERARRLAQEYVRGIPDYDYRPGSLKFIRARPRIAGVEANGAGDDENSNDASNGSFEAFQVRSLSYYA